MKTVFRITDRLACKEVPTKRITTTVAHDPSHGYLVRETETYTEVDYLDRVVTSRAVKVVGRYDNERDAVQAATEHHYYARY